MILKVPVNSFAENYPLVSCRSHALSQRNAEFLNLTANG